MSQSTNYAIMRLQKIKTQGQLKARYNHDYRIAEVKNASYTEADREAMLMSAPVLCATDYATEFANRIRNLPYYEKHSIRKNAVLAYDIVLSYSNPLNDDDYNKWVDGCIKYLNDEFCKSQDGESNLISCIIHTDETTPHIHAIVIPIDPYGKLNASYYTDGAVALRQLQSSYAEHVAGAGLTRGTERSTAKHEDIRKYYGDLNKALHNIEPPEQGETATEYYERVRDDIGAASAANLRKLKETEREYRQVKHQMLNSRFQTVSIEELLRQAELLAEMHDESEKRAEKLKELYPEIYNEIYNDFEINTIELD